MVKLMVICKLTLKVVFEYCGPQLIFEKMMVNYLMIIHHELIKIFVVGYLAFLLN